MKKLAAFLLLAAMLAAAALPCFAVEVIGQVLSTDIRAYINGAEIPAYNIDGKLAIIVSDLNNYGFKTHYNNDLRKTTVTRNYSASKFTSVPSKASGLPIGARVMDVYKSDIVVELDGRLVQAFNVDNRMAIYFTELREYGSYAYDNNSRTSSLILADAKPTLPTGPFNRLTVRYTAPTPAKLTVSYVEGSSAVTDVYYLEAGVNAEFHGLIQSYLAGKTAKDLKIVSAQSLTGGTAPVIRGIDGETIPLYSKEIYYLENERYKVGINLNWGGGISEIYDKKNTVPGLSNLINKHDTGRSIQQSYYGVEETKDYKGGVCNGVQWPYNPVQGGDFYNKPSRLIDIVVKPDSVWVKAQPADWSKNSSLTPSYMENSYSFVGDCLRVDNRHMDFSGLLPAVTGGEIPAIYTVNWFDDVVWYSGDKSWTGDTLSWDKIMDYGSDGICWKRMQVGQTETWCALMKKSADYGLGIYVPGADVYSPMGDLIGETKDAMAAESSYLGAVEDIPLGNFEAIEYSYLLATGSVSTIRSAFQKNKDLIKNEILERSNLHRRYIADYTSLDFTVSLSVETFREPRFDAVADFDTNVGTVRLTATTGIDPYLTLVYDDSTVKLSADKYKKARLTYMIPTTNSRQSYWGELFLCSGKWTETEAGISKEIPEMKADGQWHTIEIDLTASFWSGDIHSIRLDFFNECEAGDVMYIKNISLVP